MSASDGLIESIQGNCLYELDGEDTNGEKWYRCVLHGATELGSDWQCENTPEPPPYVEREPMFRVIAYREIAVTPDTIIHGTGFNIPTEGAESKWFTNMTAEEMAESLENEESEGQE